MVDFGGLQALRLARSSAVLRAVASPWYGEAVQVTSRTVRVDSLDAILDVVDRPRLAKSEQVLRAYLECDVVPYLPVRAFDGHHLGILAEVSEGRLVVLDGVHRAIAAREASVGLVAVTTVSSSTSVPPFPSTTRLADVQISEVALAPKYATMPDWLRPSTQWLRTWRQILEESP